MSKNPLKLKIAYLYPDILESFCDRANVEAFKYRANLRDVMKLMTTRRFPLQNMIFIILVAQTLQALKLRLVI